MHHEVDRQTQTPTLLLEVGLDFYSRALVVLRTKRFAIVLNRLSPRSQPNLKEIGAAFSVKAPINETTTAGELITCI